jgi:acyl-CoA thioester hydrolase
MCSSNFATSFQQTVPVEAADIDLMGHVNNIVYLRWVQEVATSHWQLLAPQEDQEKTLWVVARHEIDYKHPALLGDDVLLRTWVGSVKGLLFERHTEIRRASDEQVLAVARTLWIPVDSHTKKPQRLRAELRALFSLESEPSTRAS